MLYLIATPIGNLGDITLRALELMKGCDYLLCEDTRRSLRLLQAYELKKPLKSYHKFNEASREKTILADLEEGKTIGLLTDAGTPSIADPGRRLVENCHKQGLEVVSLPGPCAAIAALTTSGFPSDRFQFFGFLPKKKGKLTTLLEEMLLYPGTSLCYESPFRLLKTLSLLETLSPTRTLCVARELTKKFEEVLIGTPATLLQRWAHSSPKGEIVLLISPP